MNEYLRFSNQIACQRFLQILGLPYKLFEAFMLFDGMGGFSDRLNGIRMSATSGISKQGSSPS